MERLLVGKACRELLHLFLAVGTYGITRINSQDLLPPKTIFVDWLERLAGGCQAKFMSHLTGLI